MQVICRCHGSYPKEHLYFTRFCILFYSVHCFMHTYAYYFLNQIMCNYKLVNYICIGQATFERCDLSKSYRNRSPKNEPSPSGHPRCRLVFLFIFLLEKLGITLLAYHQWIHCSEWVLSGWEFKELNKTITIGPFSVSKHRDVFLWAELSWRQKDSPDRFTNASY